MKLKRHHYFLIWFTAMALTVLGSLAVSRYLQDSPTIRTTAAPTPPTVNQPVANDISPEKAAENSRFLQEKLGNDDGIAAAIFYGGSIQGSLETCG